MNYWLFKSEPDEYGIDHLKNEPQQIGRWDGIRNYQARNLLRDDAKIGDGVLFYHSSCKQVGIAGIAEIVSNPYPDPLQFDPESKYFDPKSTKENPRWVCLDIKYVRHNKKFIPLTQIKTTKLLEKMVLVNRSRLSIQPVTYDEWQIINQLAMNI